MKIEWSADALADLDRFAAFLHRHYPALAKVVAREIVEKAHVLSEQPFLGHPLPDAQNIGRLSCACSTQPMSFNIVRKANGW